MGWLTVPSRQHCGIRSLWAIVQVIFPKLSEEHARSTIVRVTWLNWRYIASGFQSTCLIRCNYLPSVVSAVNPCHRAPPFGYLRWNASDIARTELLYLLTVNVPTRTMPFFVC